MIRTKKAPKATPAQIAERAVSAWFAALINTRDTFGIPDASDALYEAFDHVTDALEAEDIQRDGPITEGQDLRRSAPALDAGYLVGVQVGLRLARGAR